MSSQQHQDLGPLLDTQQNQLTMIVAAGDSIDNKALAVLAVNVAILIFVAQASLRVNTWWHYAVLLWPLVFSLVFDGLSVLPKRYMGASINLDTHPEYLSMSREQLLLQLLADTKNAIKHNRAVNAIRWRYCLTSIILTVIGSIILFAIL